MEFTVIDIETANADYASICQIGVVDVVGGEVAAREAYLVDPEDYFDAFNVSVHGITSDQVQGAPTFPKIMESLHERFSGSIIVHHGPFDRVAFARAHERYQLNVFDAKWIDNQRVVRRTWEQFSRSGYSLKNIAKHFSIDFRHHDALEDALATCEIFRRALSETKTSVDDWSSGMSRHTLFGQKKFVGDGASEGPFSGEVIVFTGQLRIPRSEAAVIAQKLGFRVEDGVTKRTTVLCAGVQDRTRTGGYDKSSKHRKAEMLTESGQDIRIVSEEDFWALIPTNLVPDAKAHSSKSTPRPLGSMRLSLSLEDLFTEEELAELLNA